MKLFLIIIFLILFLFSILIIDQITYKKNIFKDYYKLKKKLNNIIIPYNNDNKDKINFPILYINIEKNKDRNENILNEFKKHNIKNFKRIDAVYGNNYNFNKDDIGDFKFINNFSKEFTKAELGCTLSHIKAIKYAYENNLGTVLILEDDISFDLLPFWKNSLKEITQMVPNDWRIIQLHNFTCNIDDKYFYTEGKICYSTLAYLINRDGQKKIIDMFINNTIVLEKNIQKNINNLNADDFLYPLINNFYIITIPLFFADNEKLNSTIHQEDTIGHIKRSISIMKKYLTKEKIEI